MRYGTPYPAHNPALHPTGGGPPPPGFSPITSPVVFNSYVQPLPLPVISATGPALDRVHTLDLTSARTDRLFWGEGDGLMLADVRDNTGAPTDDVVYIRFDNMTNDPIPFSRGMSRVGLHFSSFFLTHPALANVTARIWTFRAPQSYGLGPGGLNQAF